MGTRGGARGERGTRGNVGNFYEYVEIEKYAGISEESLVQAN